MKILIYIYCRNETFSYRYSIRFDCFLMLFYLPIWYGNKVHFLLNIFIIFFYIYKTHLNIDFYIFHYQQNKNIFLYNFKGVWTYQSIVEIETMLGQDLFLVQELPFTLHLWIPVWIIEHFHGPWLVAWQAGI